MIGNGILAFGVFFIVCLFLYLGFRNQSKSNDKEKAFAGIYTVEIADSFTGDSLSVYINDSLLFNSNIGDAAVKFQVKRFAEESTLMVVDNHTDEITPFNLNPEGIVSDDDSRIRSIWVRLLWNTAGSLAAYRLWLD